MDVYSFTTASGQIYACPLLTVNPIANRMFIAVSDLNFAEAAALFSNQEEMSSITYAGKTYTGYTQLDYMMQEPYGIKAQMSQPR